MMRTVAVCGIVTVVKSQRPRRDRLLPIFWSVSRIVVMPGGGLNAPSAPVPVSTLGNTAWRRPFPVHSKAPLAPPGLAVLNDSTIGACGNDIAAAVWKKSKAPGFPADVWIGFPTRSVTVGPSRIWKVVLPGSGFDA